MNEYIIGQWEKYKEDLKKRIENTNQSEYNSYIGLVRLIVMEILNKNTEYGKEYDVNEITVVDNDDYQGTQIFLIPADVYQPSEYEYLVTYVYYGSCSGCDTLEGIICNDINYSEGLPNEQQVNDYMTLCLHLIQRMKPLYEREC